MKCAKCGAELKVGCIYCSVCGQEAQIVPDYSLLEDDFLKELLKDEKKKNEVSRKNPKQQKIQPASQKKKKKKTPMVVAAIGAIILLILLIVLLINHNHKNSYDYQMDKAQDCMQDKNYVKAEKYLKQAVKLQGESTDAWLLLAESYLSQKQEDDAIDAFKQVIEIDSGNEKAYQNLIDIYAELKEYDSINELSKQVKDSKIMELFSNYIVTAPVPVTEEYNQEDGLEISFQPGTITYYTLDGSDPKKGEEYEEPVFLEEGEVTVRMISVNDLGIYSEETECVFHVKFDPPEPPKVTPDGGNFSVAQQITVDIPKGCTAYYTWDETDPTANSEPYTGPLEMPEGNNILSVILVDENDLWSDVTKCNFIYIP